jgi:hypothetical protein
MLQVLHPLLNLGARFGALVGDGRLREADAAKRALEALDRWTRQMNTPYADLSEKEKDSDREWADKVLEIFPAAVPSPLDNKIIRVVQDILSHAHFVVETPNESVLVKLMEERGNPIDIDGSVRPIDEDYQRYLTALGRWPGGGA